MDILSFIVGITLGGIAAWQFRRPESTNKQQRLDKIISLVKRQDKITNNDVEILLGVSNASAERYLNELEHKGHLKQVGKTGKFVYYEAR